MRRTSLARAVGFLAVGFLAAGILAAAPATVRAGAPDFADQVRSLQRSQDELVYGRSSAGDPGAALVALARTIRSAPRDAWQEPKNAAALVVYLLSGGRAAPARELLAAGAIAEHDVPLVRGAAAYTEGREGEARALLLPIDAASVRPSLQGHLALAQAALIGPNDPVRANERLDLARLLAPGTIIEETALRREIVSAGETAQFGRFLALTDQYVRRFGSSVYAAAFRQRLMETAMSAALASDPATLDGLQIVLDTVPPAERARPVLGLARAALVRGKTRLARLAAEVASRQAEAGSLEADRAVLYRSAADVVTEDGISDRVQRLSAQRLDTGDRDILLAVQTLAPRLRAWPPPEEGAPAPAQTSPASRPLIAASEATYESATQALSRADAAMRRDGR